MPTIVVGDVTVPDVVGASQSAAETAALDVFIVPMFLFELSDTILTGIVIRQGVPGGTQVPPGYQLDIVVSSGLPRRESVMRVRV